MWRSRISSPNPRRLQRCGVQGFLLPTLDLRLGALRLGLIRHLQVGTFFALLSVALALGHLVVAVPAATTIVDEAPTTREAPSVPAATHPCEAPAEIADMVGSAELPSPTRGRRLQRCGVQGFLLPTLDLRLGALRLGLIRHLQVGTFFALLSVALALGHLVVAVPAATTIVDE